MALGHRLPGCGPYITMYGGERRRVIKWRRVDPGREAWGGSAVLVTRLGGVGWVAAVTVAPATSATPPPCAPDTLLAWRLERVAGSSRRRAGSAAPALGRSRPSYTGPIPHGAPASPPSSPASACPHTGCAA